ncbi:MAG: sigma factor-like helix-turn-helix DNA-binding protein [Kofleriaceae bacterium]|nr:sigma factor-like helix-turn-helix DNA-binding protein [Kofleriaceae bacterium]
MSDVIDAMFDAGRAAWPEIELAREHLALHVVSHEIDAVQRYPADLYLAAACLSNNPSALAVFERDMLAPARAAIGSIDSSAAFVDEACQRLRASLLVGHDGRPRIADYAARGPLRAWVGVAAVRIALMMRRAQVRSKEVVGEDDDWTEALTAISTGDPELELLKRQYAAAFTEALRAAVAQLEPRLRTALRMSFVDNLSIDQIGAVYNVHRATCARWIQRACQSILEQTRARLAERLKLSPSELDRVTALVQSQIDVSLSQLLPANLA